MNFDKALARARAQMSSGETERGAVRASLKNPGKNLNPGALLLTDQRLIFVGSLMFERANVSIPLLSMTSIDSHGVGLGFTTISMGGAKHRFLTLPPAFIAHVEQVRGETTAGLHTSTSSSTPSSDIGDQIEKLASLRAAGVLSDEEFSTAKSRLLA